MTSVELADELFDKLGVRGVGRAFANEDYSTTTLYTLEQLLDILPHYIIEDGKKLVLTIQAPINGVKSWGLRPSYDVINTFESVYNGYGQNLRDMLTDLAITMLKSGHIKTTPPNHITSNR